jgi:molybdenum cofactor cytidylyltransferase
MSEPAEPMQAVDDSRVGDSRVGAVILAAGMSTRMGEAKQLVRLGDSSLLRSTYENVRAASVDEIVLVLGFAAETIKPQFAPEKVKIVINEAYREGMATSLRQGLFALSRQTAAALIILADQPLVRPQTLDRLIAEYRRSQSSASRAEIVIPTYKGFRGNPVLLDRSVFPEVMALQGDMGCRAIFGSHLEGIVTIAVDDIGILLDIDRKEDLEQLERIRQEKGSETALFESATSEPRPMPRPMRGAEATPAQPELFIVGSEPIAVALAKMGNLLHFSVTVVDPLLQPSGLCEQVRLLDSLDFSHLPANPDRSVVIATRGRFDEEAVEQALAAGSGYIALVANKKRGQEVLERLRLKGENPDRLASVRVPAGLDIGAETAEEIALSILAQIVSERRKGRAGKGPGTAQGSAGGKAETAGRPL